MKKIFTISILSVIGLFLVGGIAKATTSFLSASAASGTASTTIAYMTAGTATTTVYYDAYARDGSNENVVNEATVADSAIMNIQYTASSTASILNTDFEFSNGNNCQTTPSGCDWYQSTIVASTTRQNINLTDTISWTFASTSQGKAGILGNNNRALKTMNVPTPMRYVRAIFTVPIGASNGGVYAEILPKKQMK